MFPLKFNVVDKWGRGGIFMTLDGKEYTRNMGKRVPEIRTPCSALADKGWMKLY